MWVYLYDTVNKCINWLWQLSFRKSDSVNKVDEPVAAMWWGTSKFRLEPSIINCCIFSPFCKEKIFSLFMFAFDACLERERSKNGIFEWIGFGVYWKISRRKNVAKTLFYSDEKKERKREWGREIKEKEKVKERAREREKVCMCVREAVVEENSLIRHFSIFRTTRTST